MAESDNLINGIGRHSAAGAMAAVFFDLEWGFLFFSGMLELSQHIALSSSCHNVQKLHLGVQILHLHKALIYMCFS